jgi:hypothetical protein
VPAAKKAAGPSSFRDRSCNVVPSKDTETDFGYASSLASGAVTAGASFPASVDLRASWWKINDQEVTGSCVGWATADGVVRWAHGPGREAEQGQDALTTPRLDGQQGDRCADRAAGDLPREGGHHDQGRAEGGASLRGRPGDRPALHIDTTMYTGSEDTFYTRCAKHRIASNHNLHHDLDAWKHWLADQGPILVALLVDSSWDNAGLNAGKIDAFQPDTVRGGHAVAVVGYRKDGRFIVRNSWGTSWGVKGFGYVKPSYIADSFFPEAYGVTI